MPIQLSFQSNAGELTIVAKSYALSVRRGTLVIREPRIQDSSGVVLAQLDSLEATGIQLFGGADRSVKVRGHNLRGRLRRLRNGAFDLQDYMPAHQTAASIIPFEVEVDHCAVQFIDMESPDAWTRTITSPSIKVAGLGRDWIAVATAAISGVGTIESRIQNVQGQGLYLTASTQSLQLSAVLAHFLETAQGANIPELRGLSCASLNVRGPFRIFIPTSASPRVEAMVDLKANGIQNGKYSATTASFVGQISTQGLAGSLKVTNGDVIAAFRGAALWTKRSQAAGDVSVSVPKSGSLPEWAKAFLPKGTSFGKASFGGWASLDGANSFHVSGNLSASTVGASGQQLDDVLARIDAERERVVVDLKLAKFAGEPVSGIAMVEPKQQTIRGALFASRVDLAAAGAKFGFKQFAGEASVSALLGGTISKPSVDFLTSGQGIATFFKDHTVSLGKFEAAGTYAKGELELARATFNTPEGLISAHGNLGNTGNIGLSVTGRGVLIAAYDPAFSGAANFVATVTGTLQDPSATGRVEGYDVTYKTRTVPAVVANFKVDRRHATIDDLQAARGTASLTGSGRIEFPSGQLIGTLSARDIQVADWLGDDFVGAVDIPNVDISGTISHPLVGGHVEGASLVAKGVKLDSLSAAVQADGSIVSVQNLTLKAAEGKLSASATYDLEKRAGSISASVSGLSLDKLMPELDNSIVVSGKVSGQAKIAVRGSDFTGGQAEGTLSSLILNGSEVGSGDWSIQSDGTMYTGGLEVGALDRFVQFSNVSYDPEAKRASGQLNVLHFQAENIIATGLRYFPDLTFDAKDNLQSLEGSVDLGCSFNGTLQDPELNVDKLSISDITYRKEPLGRLDTSFQLKGHKWAIQSLTLSQGPAEVALHGTIDEHGDTHIDATQDNRFDLAKLARFDTRISRLTGTAHVWLSADGPSNSPRIVASVNVDNLFAPPEVQISEDDSDKYLRFELDKIVLDPSKSGSPGAVFSGAYFYKGFRGSIDGDLPFEYPFKLTANKPVRATITFDKSDLKDMAPLVGGLDAKRTAGTVAGLFQVAGTSDALGVTGKLNFDAETLAFTGIDDFLTKFKATVTLAPQLLSVSATGEPSRGGTLSASLSTPAPELGQLVTQIEKEGPASLLDRTLSGHASIARSQVRQKILGQSSVAGIASSELNFGGTLRKPTINGNVALASGDVLFSGLPTATPKDEILLINPSFDVQLALDGPARLKSATAEMYLVGSGTLQGSLQTPVVDASLSVDKGTIRLPGGLLRLDQGGAVKINYGVTGPRSASAVVDLEGNTSIAASRSGDTDIQRYDITLGMKGDLLLDNGLVLTPSSDPPDLPPDRILAMLGEANILTSMTPGGTSTGAAIQVAFLSSVPGLLDPYTGDLARGLGLDYLSLEYNMIDQASVAFGKALGWGFSFEGTRQISEPPIGFAYRYDFRILYRPRRLPGALNRVSLFVGSDQDNPWKVGIQYGVKF